MKGRACVWIGLLVGAVWCPRSSTAQDVRFSQFFLTPHAQNPANIGAFDGEWRIGGVFRQQWRAVTVPYRTFGLGGDRRNAFGVEGLGLGAWILNDRAGDSRLNTFNAALGVSWTERFGPNEDHAITLGLHGGYTALSIDYSALRFDNQYNGYRYANVSSAMRWAMRTCTREWPIGSNLQHASTTP